MAGRAHLIGGHAGVKGDRVVPWGLGEVDQRSCQLHGCIRAKTTPLLMSPHPHEPRRILMAVKRVSEAAGLYLPSPHDP